MKNVLIFLLLSCVLISKADNLSKIKIYEPIVANKVADKFVPAYFQEIDGFLGYRMNVNIEKRLLLIDSTTILSGFRKRPGSQTWLGEHMGKFLFSASNTYKYSNNERLKRLTDVIVKEYIACQLPDGYLGTYLPKNYWTAWDVWAHKYAIIGLLNYYAVTGNQPAMEAAKKAGDLICRTFGDEPGKRDIIRGAHVGMAPGSILEPMVDLYRYTSDKKYLDFCEYILRAYEQPNGPKIISGLEKYGKVTKVGNGKAYEMMSCFLGILKYYKLTGEIRYLKALETAWKDIRDNRMYITGTSSVREYFQEDGIMPAENSNHMGEGCVTVTWLQFNLQLLQITGELKYSEELERTVYNQLLAAENPQTGCVSYYTALQGVKPYKCDQGYSCCLSSVPRGISLLPDLVWGKINGAFSILMVEAGEVADSVAANDNSGVALKIKSVSRFPHEGKVKYTIIPSANKVFTINFRVPGWAKNYTAKIGKEFFSGVPGKLLKIERRWKANDVVNVLFEMPVEVLSGGISYPGKIALKRGPQVMAVDQLLNAGVDSIRTLICAKEKITLKDAEKDLPSDWSWKQAYSLPMSELDKTRKVILVPYSEAGQKNSYIRTWIDAK
ncbi:MAG: glycoside hydrolase family 127 protein [Prolixibacteraceae bacterium]|jgi:hypothetical protein|nr:glycoside hydrolase family 127 protein [Prolixibacteraceae bacterium]